MAFEKGQSGNPTGRKKGTQNKSTAEMRGIIQEIINTNFSNSKIARDLKELSPKYRLEFYLKLLEYSLPKPLPEEIKDNYTPKSNFFENVYNQMRTGMNNEYVSTIQGTQNEIRISE